MSDVSPLSSEVRRAAAWSGASTLLLKFANIGVTAVVVRLVTPKEFGIFAVALTVYAVVSSMSELGVISVLTRNDTNADRIAPTVGLTALASSTVLAVTMTVFAKQLASSLGAADAAGTVRVMAIPVFLVGLFAVPCATLAREFKQDKIFLANVVAFVPTNALLIILATRGDGAMAFAWSRALGQVLVGLIITVCASRRLSLGFDRREFRFVVGLGLPLAGANLVGYLLLNADYAFVGRALGATELGIYMLAFNIAGWSTALLSSAINAVAMPAFSRVQSDPRRLGQLLIHAGREVARISLPIGALTVATSDDLIRVVYGGRWSAAAPVLSVLAIYGAVFAISLLFANVLAGTSRQARTLLVIQVVWLAALVPTMYAGLRLWGVLGVALAHVVVIIAVVLPGYLVALRRLANVNAGRMLVELAPIALTSIASGVAAAMVDRLPLQAALRLALAVLVGGGLYAVFNGQRLASSARSTRLGRHPIMATVTAGLSSANRLVGRQLMRWAPPAVRTWVGDRAV